MFLRERVLHGRRFHRATWWFAAASELFYDRIPLRPLANALLSADNTAVIGNLQQLSISLSPTQAGAPVFPGILGSLTIPAGVLFNFSTMNPNIKNAYSEQGNIEIEQQIGKSGTLAAGYDHVRGLHLIVSINQNVPTCTAAGTNDGCRPNLTYGNNSQYSSAADSHYDAAHISFVERPVKWGNYRISYTYSKALDDVSEFFFSAPINNFNIWQDYSRADDDQRSRLTFEGSVHTSTAAAATPLGTSDPRVPAFRFAGGIFPAAIQHYDRQQYDSGDLGAPHYQWGIH